MLRPRIGRVEVRKVDKLSTIRVASARYSVPHRLVGAHVEAVTFDGKVRIYDLDGGLVADHVQLAPGEAAVLDEHYPTPRRAPSRGPRVRTDVEREFLALGEPAEAFIRQGAAAGMTIEVHPVRRTGWLCGDAVAATVVQVLPFDGAAVVVR